MNGNGYIIINCIILWERESDVTKTIREVRRPKSVRRTTIYHDETYYNLLPTHAHVYYTRIVVVITCIIIERKGCTK